MRLKSVSWVSCEMRSVSSQMEVHSGHVARRWNRLCQLHHYILTDGSAVVPAAEVHPLTNKFNWRLCAEYFERRHVEVVDEENEELAQRRSKHSLTTTMSSSSSSRLLVFVTQIFYIYAVFQKKHPLILLAICWGVAVMRCQIMWGILVSKIIKIRQLLLNLLPIIWVDVFFWNTLYITFIVANLRLLDRDCCCSGYMHNGMWIMLCLRTETADSISVTATEPVVDIFGRMTYCAMALKLISQNVDTTAGELTSADIRTTSLSLASRETVCGSKHWH